MLLGKPSRFQKLKILGPMFHLSRSLWVNCLGVVGSTHSGRQSTNRGPQTLGVNIYHQEICTVTQSVHRLLPADSVLLDCWQEHSQNLMTFLLCQGWAPRSATVTAAHRGAIITGIPWATTFSVYINCFQTWKNVSRVNNMEDRWPISNLL